MRGEAAAPARLTVLEDQDLIQQQNIDCAIGTQDTGCNVMSATRFLSYLATKKAQGIYESYGVVPATDCELQLKPIPAAK